MFVSYVALESCFVNPLQVTSVPSAEFNMLKAMKDESVRRKTVSHSVVLECVIENYFSVWIISLMHVSGFIKSQGRWDNSTWRGFQLSQTEMTSPFA